VLPQRFSSIRALALHLKLQSFKWDFLAEEWEQMWCILIGLEHLNTFHVKLTSYMGEDQGEEEKDLIARLRRVKCRGDFVVLPDTRRLAHLLETKINDGTFVVKRDHLA
jgi:hypothetical protein